VEIIDFLRLSRRRVLVLVGVPVLAAAAATAMVVTASDTFSATATVSAPALVGGAAGNQYTGSQAVNQFVAAFQATAQGPTVRQSVSDATHVPGSDIAKNLSVSQIGASSVMTLTYTSQNRTSVEPVLTALTRQTLQQMFGSQVTLAEGQISAAKEDLTTANAAIVEWEQKNGMVAPEQIYQARIDQINSLLQQQTALQANGKSAGAAAVGASIATARGELAKFAPKLAEYQILAATRDAATAGLTQAQQNLVTARSQSEAADPAKVAFISGEHPVGEGPSLLSTVLPITGAGVFVAVVLVAILELAAASRRSRAAADESAAPSSETDDTNDTDDTDDTDDTKPGRQVLSGEHVNGHSAVPLVEHSTVVGAQAPRQVADRDLVRSDADGADPTAANGTLTAARE
jgi:uncharacterized protein involved in exopolysaccharide biosynthesis